MIPLSVAKEVLKDRQVEWEQVKTLEHYLVHKICYVYLVFKTPKEAAAVYYTRHLYELQLRKLHQTSNDQATIDTIFPL